MLVPRNDLICATALLAVWLLVWIPRLHGPIDLRWDGSTYFVLGTAIAEGKGYRLLNEPGKIEAVQYPPLLPLIVAAHERLLGTNNYVKVGCALRYFYFVISGIYLFAVYALARKLLSPVYSLVTATILAFSFYSFFHPSDALYADLPFALLSTLFLLCQQGAGETSYRSWLQPALAGAAYFLRTAGITLLAAWVLEAAIQRWFRQATLRAAISLIPVLVWQMHVHQVTSSSQYRQVHYPYQRASYYYSNVTYRENATLRDPFRPEVGRATVAELAGRTVSNIIALPLGLGESAFVPASFGATFVYELHHVFRLPLPHHWKTRSSRAFSILLFAAGLVSLAGSVVIARTSRWFLSLYFGLTIVLVTLTPWQNQFWRYLAAVAPLTVIFFVCVLFSIQRWTTLPLRTHPMLLKLVTFLPLFGIVAIQTSTAAAVFKDRQLVTYYDDQGRELRDTLLTYGSAWHALDLAFEWIRLHAKARAIVATTVPQLAYLRTGHQAVLPPMDPDPTAAASLLGQVPVSYVVLDRLGLPGISERYAAPVVAQAPSNWQLVFATPDSQAEVYERMR